MYEKDNLERQFKNRISTYDELESSYKKLQLNLEQAYNDTDEATAVLLHERSKNTIKMN